MWMGATATFGGVTPDYVTLWNPTTSFEEKVQEIINIMDNEDTRCKPNTNSSFGYFLYVVIT